jgi:hypothetical protein
MVSDCGQCCVVCCEEDSKKLSLCDNSDDYGDVINSDDYGDVIYFIGKVIRF